MKYNKTNSYWRHREIIFPQWRKYFPWPLVLENISQLWENRLE